MSIRVFDLKQGLKALLCATSLLVMPTVAVGAVSTVSALTEADLRVLVSSDLSVGTFVVDDWYSDSSGDTTNDLVDLFSAVLKVRRRPAHDGIQ